VPSDIADFLSFEVKKELADRYFSFRRLIEEDKESFAHRIRESEFTLGQLLCRDLVRIYILLQTEAFISEFLAISGLDERIFYDPYLLESPTIRQRVFAGVRPRGLTLAGKFKHLFLDCYEELEEHVGRYRERLAELQAQWETIDEEIKLFSRRHDLGGIMDFLRRLDSSGGGTLDATLSPAHHESLTAKMRFTPPPPVDTLLTIIPAIPAIGRVRHRLKDLASRAYARHGRKLLREILSQQQS